MPEVPRFHPEVARELQQALDFGLQRWPNLVGDLLEEYSARVESVVREDPEQRREIANGVKRINLRHNFPYHIIYLPWKGSIYVVAFCHNTQRPGYWTDRLGDLE